MVSRIKKLKNTSLETVTIQLKDGFVITVPPGQILENVEILNLNEIRGKTMLTLDLTEVKESKNLRKLNG